MNFAIDLPINCCCDRGGGGRGVYISLSLLTCGLVGQEDPALCHCKFPCWVVGQESVAVSLFTCCFVGQEDVALCHCSRTSGLISLPYWSPGVGSWGLRN